MVIKKSGLLAILLRNYLIVNVSELHTVFAITIQNTILTQ